MRADSLISGEPNQLRIEKAQRTSHTSDFMKNWDLGIKSPLLILCTDLIAATTAAEESNKSPRESFVKYFQAMDAGQRDAAQALLPLAALLHAEKALYSKKQLESTATHMAAFA